MTLSASLASGGYSGGTVGASTTVTAKTADYAVTGADTGTTFTTTGAGGAVRFTLPAATTTGRYYRFVVGAAQNLIVDAAGTDVIYLGDTATSAGGTLTANAVGSMVEVECTASGVWTARATASWTPA